MASPISKKVERSFLEVTGLIAVKLIFLPTTGGAILNPRILKGRRRKKRRRTVASLISTEK